MVPTSLSSHLFELVERELRDPDVALRIPDLHQLGDLDLYDYLFTTAPTMRCAMRAGANYSHLVSTNTRLDIESGPAVRPVTQSGRSRRRGAGEN